MKVKSQIIFPHVYLLTYPTQYELCMSLVRIQEFYESPKFRNKYFTLEEFMDYWSLSHCGNFSYPSMWNGFNIPGDVLKKWISKCGENRDHLREREKHFIGLVGKLMTKEKMEINFENADKIYIIGVHKNSSDLQNVISHELAHSFYRFYPEYKRSCKKIAKNLEEQEKKVMFETLTLLGYCKNVMEDEIQAYSSTYSSESSYRAVLKNHLMSEFRANFESFKSSVKEN